ncbi:MAG: sugar phosphate isomerase/epimerase [Devosia sp.]|uniref:sugar phosphate isomerase/epimerase family protein n=1 Tax=Devosia sp. 66-22 TaxID=1895753 RepID=UPI001AC9A48B|nr:sugar phosphate isomerase/epimerase family protein [Devosia sp. 66-22]MBN9346571.1 sugar phosphate isomerase/epimerase [Devosia sp.]
MSQITTMPLPLVEDLPAFSRAGFAATELQIDKVNRFVATSSVEALIDMLATLKLKPTGAIGLAPSGPALLLARGSVFDEYLVSLRQQLELCRRIGIDQIGIGADASKWKQEDNWRTGAVSNILRAARIADDTGVRIGLEFMSLGAPIGPFILDTLAETREIVAEVDRDSVGYNIDLFHHYRSNGTVDELKTVRAVDVVGVHVTDVGPGDKPTLGDGDRVLPGKGVAPVIGYRDALIGAGYDGYWTLELLNESLWKLDPEETARLGLASMRAFAAASAQN